MPETTNSVVEVDCEEIAELFLSELRQVVDDALAEQRTFEEGFETLDLGGDNDCPPDPEQAPEIADGIDEMYTDIIENAELTDDGTIGPLTQDVLAQLAIVGSIFTVTAPPEDPLPSSTPAVPEDDSGSHG